MGKPVACKKCGGTKWTQFELRKMELVILGGVPCMSTHCIIQPVKLLKCQGCGDLLTSDESRVIRVHSRKMVMPWPS